MAAEYDLPDRTAVEDGPVQIALLSRTDPADLTRSMHDRLCFRQAQSLLAGLCGCTQQRAAQALLSTAARLGIASAHVGAQFLAVLGTYPGERPAVDNDPEHLVSSLLEVALSPSGHDPAQRGSQPPVPPEPLPEDMALAVTRAARTDPGPLDDSAHVRRSVMLAERGHELIVTGELDVATGAPLQDAVKELGWGEPSPDHDRPRLHIDLTAVSFIDISGVQALNDLHAYVDRHDGRLHVTPPVARAPRRLLRYAARSGWLAPGFAPGDPTHALADDLGTVEPIALSGT